MSAGAPHHLFLVHRGLCLAAAAASTALSLWAIHVDPVINNDGILYIEAARHFGDGEWRAGFEVYKWPFYSFLISLVGDTTGLAPGHSAYLLNAALYMTLVLGFVALVRALGGGKAALWSATILALAHPVLNEFRSFIIRDVGYWACYLWSLAYFFAYLRDGRRSLLSLWLVFALLAFLFRIEGIVLVVLLPACLYLVRARGARRTAAAGLLALLAVFVVAVSPLWHYLSEIGTSRAALVTDPVQHVLASWQAGAAGLMDRLAGLQRDFPGIAGAPAALLVYLVTALLMALTETVKTIGIVFTGLAVYAGWRITVLLPDRQRRWWLVLALIQALLVLLFVLSSFFLAERYPVGLALVILAVIPLMIEEVWEGRSRQGTGVTWRGAALAALLLVESVEGLNVATEKQYIKDAGLWLRAQAAPGSSLYSNNRILAYYAGLDETKPDNQYTWQEAMSEVWTDSWRAYDYFALVMEKRAAGHEVLLLRRMDARPVRRFTGEDGDQVLVFRPR